MTAAAAAAATAKQQRKGIEEITNEVAEIVPTSPITKSASTPASLQTIVRFQNGSNMSLQHKVSHSLHSKCSPRV